MRDQEKSFPEIFRHPGSKRARDEQTAGDILPHCEPIHHKIVAGSSEAFLGCDALPKCALRHAHVHFGVAFHLAFETLVRLCARFGNEFTRQKHTEQHRDEYDHQRPSQELGGGKLPAHEHNNDDGQLRDQISGGKLERHRRREVRAFSEN